MRFVGNILSTLEVTLKRRDYDASGFAFPADWTRGACQDGSLVVQFPNRPGTHIHPMRMNAKGSSCKSLMVGRLSRWLLEGRLSLAPPLTQLTGAVRWNLGSKSGVALDEVGMTTESVVSFRRGGVRAKANE